MTTFSDLITSSIKRTGDILFRPFLFKKWVFLGVVALLGGYLGGGGGGDSLQKALNASKQQQKMNLLPSSDAAIAVDVVQPAPEAKDYRDVIVKKYDKAVDQGPSKPFPRLSNRQLVAIVAFVFVIYLFFSWLGARFKFVFLDDLARNDASVKGPFITYGREGDSLFFFNLFISVAMIAVLTGIFIWQFPVVIKAIQAGAPLTDVFSKDPWPWLRFIFLSLLAVFPAGLIMLFADDFVIPLMLQRRIRVVEACRKAIHVINAHPLRVVQYVFLKIGLGICVFIATVIVSIIFLAVMLLVGALIGGLLYVIGRLMPTAAQHAYGIVVTVIAVIALVITAFLGNLLALPFAVFFRIFSAKFFSTIEPSCDIFPEVIDAVDQSTRIQ
jgi:hypothetical protein